MKTSQMLTMLAGALCAGLIAVHAAEQKLEAGPKGGRILEKTDPKAEFFVEKDKAVTIAFYDAKLKPVPAGDQTVTVIADAKTGRAKIEFEKKGGVLVSKTKLPEGEGYSVVVQFKQNASAKPQNYRFLYESYACAECKRAEYACICGH